MISLIHFRIFKDYYCVSYKIAHHTFEQALIGIYILQTQLSHEKYYGKCSKISNTFSLSVFTKMLVNRSIIHKMIVKIANREDPDQAASLEAV